MNRLVLILSLVVASIHLNAQDFGQVTSDLRIIGDSTAINATMYSQKKLGESDKWGYSAFGLVTAQFAEFYAGPTYSPNDELTIGVSIGFENGFENLSTDFRAGSSLTYFPGNHSLLLFYERGKGDGNYWYSATYEYKYKSTSIGAIAKRYYGSGPSLAYTHKSIKLTFSPLWDHEDEVLKNTFFLTHTF